MTSSSVSSSQSRAASAALVGDRPQAPLGVLTAAGLIGLIVLAGLGNGALTQLGQTYLPAGLEPWANSSAMWLLVAFLVGALLPSLRWAAAAGPIVLLGSLVGYYVTQYLLLSPTVPGIGVSPSVAGYWTVMAVVAGPIYGAAGWAWRHRTAWAWPGVAVLVAAFWSEALWRLTQLSAADGAAQPTGWVMLAAGLVIGLALPGVAVRPARLPLLGVAALASLALFGSQVALTAAAESLGA